MIGSKILSGIAKRRRVAVQAGESSNGTDITTVGPSIINSIGEAWTLQSDGQVAVNGVPSTHGGVADTASVVELYYSWDFTPHRVYQKNSSNLWWWKVTSADAWTSDTNPHPTESPNGTDILSSGPFLRNSALDAFSISNSRVAINGSLDLRTSNVTEIYYSWDFSPHRVYYKDATNWFWIVLALDSAWTAGSDPHPAVTPGTILFNPGVSTTPTAGSSGTSVVVNLTTPTTAVLNRAMFGAADTTFGPQNFNHICPDGSGAWDFGLLSDTTFQNLVRPMGIKFVRMHAHTVIGQTFAGFPSVSNPDWFVVDSLRQADLNACFPGADFLINLQYSQNVTSNISAVASAYAAVAQRMKNNGVYIKYWSPCNEANHFPSPNYSGTQIGTLMAAVGTALHNVDQTYQVGGGDHDNASADLLAGAAGTGNAQFINWHAYFENAQEASEDQILNTQGVNFGEAARQAQIDARSGRAGNYLTGNSEWNMNFAPASDNDPRQQSYIGALFQTIMRIHGAWSGMAFTSMFRLSYPDHFYPALVNFKDGLYSPGFALKALNAQVPAGNLVSIAMNRADGFGKLSGMCSVGGGQFGLVLVNRDVNLAMNNFPVTFGSSRVSTSNLTKFYLDSANQNGVPSVVTPGTLHTLPAKSMMILSGAV